VVVDGAAPFVDVHVPLGDLIGEEGKWNRGTS
jgi:hypothetical protein